VSEAEGIGIVLLAAGESSRMGEPKQLLRFEGETLLGRAVRAALESGCRPVVVVLGAEASVLLEEVGATGVLTVVNQAWPEGMSSSIRCGLRALEAEDAGGAVSAVILMLCDQPFVNADTLGRLVKAHSAGQALVVASEYEAAGERTLGVPALFSRALFPELMLLRGAAGARGVIQRHLAEASLIDAPEAAFDIDTPDDYRAASNLR